MSNSSPVSKDAVAIGGASGFIGRALGQALSRSSHGGHFELRQALDNRALLIAIHDYRPRLPLLVSICTQALLHLRVMSSFRRHLARIGRE